MTRSTGERDLAGTDVGSPEQWLDDHGDALYRYAMVHLRDPHRAEDVVQETLLAALQARERFGGGASVRTWLIGILKHKIVDQFRRDAREAPGDGDPVLDLDMSGIEEQFDRSGHWRNAPVEWGDPAQLLGREQFWEILQRCLNELPERLARLFLLREVLGSDTDEVCQEMQVTPTNLWTMLHRARMGLRRCLDANWGRGVREVG